jgi:hypothetical protein
MCLNYCESVMASFRPIFLSTTNETLLVELATGISCIVKPRIHSGNCFIRLVFFLFGKKIASLFDQKFRMKYLLFKKTRRAFSSKPIPKSIYLIISMHACVYIKWTHPLNFDMHP